MVNCCHQVFVCSVAMLERVLLKLFLLNYSFSHSDRDMFHEINRSYCIMLSDSNAKSFLPNAHLHFVIITTSNQMPICS